MGKHKIGYLFEFGEFTTIPTPDASFVGLGAKGGHLYQKLPGGLETRLDTPSQGAENVFNVSDGNGGWKATQLKTNTAPGDNRIQLDDNNYMGWVDVMGTIAGFYFADSIQLRSDAPYVFKHNGSAFVPTNDNHIVNKKYVDDSISFSGLTENYIPVKGASGLVDSVIYQDANGLVGFNTQTPEAFLDISSSDLGSVLGLKKINDHFGGAAVVGRKARGTPSAILPAQENDVVTGVFAQVWSGDNWRPVGTLRFFSDGTTTTTSTPGRLEFQVQPDGSSAGGTMITAMVIKNNGNVGIGTTTPEVPFHLYSDDPADVIFSSNYSDVINRRIASFDMRNDWNGDMFRFVFRKWNPGGLGSRHQIIQTVYNSSHASPWRQMFVYDFTTGNALYGQGAESIDFGSSNTTNVRFFNAGNFGINTDDPKAKLHVHDGKILVGDFPYAGVSQEQLVISSTSNKIAGIRFHISDGNTVEAPAGHPFWTIGTNCTLTDDTSFYLRTGGPNGGNKTYLFHKSGDFQTYGLKATALTEQTGFERVAVMNTSGVFGYVAKSSFVSKWTPSGTNIYSSNTGYVGIGTTPSAKLHVKLDDSLDTNPVCLFRQDTVYGQSSVIDAVQMATNFPIARFYMNGTNKIVEMNGSGLIINQNNGLYLGEANSTGTWRLSSDSTTLKVGLRGVSAYDDSYLNLNSLGLMTVSSENPFDFISVIDEPVPDTPNAKLVIKYNGTTYQLPAYIEK